MFKVLLVFGTRPEAIKMCPLAMELKKHNEIDCKICLTSQHKEMLDQVMKVFNLKIDYNLYVMKEKQSLTTITTSVLEKIEPVLIEEKPNMILVHGDTTTSFAAAMGAFYQKIPVGHVEAGLRTGHIYSPFPEEMNRLLTDRISTLFFAPTERNRQNLLREGIDQNVYVTGNTVIDAFQYTVKDNYWFHEGKLRDIEYSKKRIILLTAHRRENLGEPLQNICNGVKELAYNNDIIIIYPVHYNPAVRDIVYKSLEGIDNVVLIDPIDVLDMHNLLPKCFMVMTDSGGLQEEAPHFGKPVLVLRKDTERPEAVDAGTVKVVGTNQYDIVREAQILLDSKDEYRKMAKAINPYGDGHASERICEEIYRRYLKG